MQKHNLQSYILILFDSIFTHIIFNYQILNIIFYCKFNSKFMQKI